VVTSRWFSAARAPPKKIRFYERLGPHARNTVGIDAGDRSSRACSTYSRHPLIAHRVVEDHAEDGKRFVDRASADPQVICPLLHAGFCVTGLRFQDACDERPFDPTGNAEGVQIFV
jgi:hypothetical protein